MAGTIRNLYVDGPPADVTFLKNGSDTSLTTAKGSYSGNRGSDTVNTVSVSAGDLITIKRENSDSSGEVRITWVWESTTGDNEFPIFVGNVGASYSSNRPRFLWLGAGQHSIETNFQYNFELKTRAELNAELSLPVNKFKLIDAYAIPMPKDGLGDNIHWSIEIYKNEVATGTMLKVLGDGTDLLIDTSTRMTVAAGDRLAYKFVFMDGGSTQVSQSVFQQYAGFCFVADTDHKFPVFGAHSDIRDSLSFNVDSEFQGAEGYFDAFTDYPTRQQIVSDFTITDMYVSLWEGAAGGGESATFTIRVNGSNSSLAVSLSAGQSNNSASGSLALAVNDLIDIDWVVTGDLGKTVFSYACSAVAVADFVLPKPINFHSRTADSGQPDTEALNFYKRYTY